MDGEQCLSNFFGLRSSVFGLRASDKFTLEIISIMVNSLFRWLLVRAPG
jgi:hypothetical protein